MRISETNVGAVINRLGLTIGAFEGFIRSYSNLLHQVGGLVPAGVDSRDETVSCYSDSKNVALHVSYVFRPRYGNPKLGSQIETLLTPSRLT